MVQLPATITTHLPAQLTTLPFHLHQLVAAALVYSLLFIAVAPPLSRALLGPKYTAFDRRTRANWNVRVVSTIQAVFLSALALRLLNSAEDAFVSETPVERIWAYSAGTGRVQAFAAGYFVWDLVVSVLYFECFGLSSLVHAVAALVVTVFGFWPFANYYGLRFVLYELSTPFLNIHWFLDKLALTGSRVQLVNGIILLATFFSCRLLWGFYQSANFYRDAWAIWGMGPGVLCSDAAPQWSDLGLQGEKGLVDGRCRHEAPGWLVVVYLVSNTVLCGLNVFWFGMMVKAVGKRFGKGKGKGKAKTR